MKYDLEKKAGGIFEATVKLANDEWNEYINSAYEKNKSKYTVQGFRKGHAPRNVIEKTYGAGVFLQEALDDVFYKSYTQILKEHEEVKPVDAPKMDIKKINDNGIEILLSIPCVPDFEIGTYKGLEFTKKINKVTDEMIKDAIDRELLRGSKLVESNKPVKNDDIVTLDFEGFIDGKAFDGGKAENYQLKIGSHSFIDTFEDQLVGLNVGDEKDVVVNFPENYHQKDLAGKPATFKCKINMIRERVMPEFNDEFVQNSSSFDTVEEFKKDLIEKLTKQEDERSEIVLDNKILDTIIDSTNVEIPTVMVDNEAERMMKGFMQQLAYQGATLDDYATYLGKTIDEIKADQRTVAERQCKGRLVLEKLIRDEKLDVTEADIDAKLTEYATNQNKTLEEYKKTVNDDMVNRIANELIMKNLLDFLRQNNTIKE